MAALPVMTLLTSRAYVVRAHGVRYMGWYGLNVSVDVLGKTKCVLVITLGHLLPFEPISKGAIFIS